MNKRPSFRTIALTLTTLALPLSALAGAITSAVLKTNNPENIDITAGLAYLGSTMTVAYATLGVISLIVVALIVAMYRQTRNFVEAKLPLVLFTLLVMIIGALLVLTSYTNSVQDQYLRDHSQITSNKSL